MSKWLRDAHYANALKQGCKIGPEDLAGMIGLPSVGDIWYVDPGAGSDTGNGGQSRDDAYATVAKAYDSATADQDDVILITPSSSTGRTSETAAIVWAKRRTHLIGSTAPTQFNPRAGMSFGSAVVSPCLTISNRSCIFKNITISNMQDINVTVEMTSDYNYFEGVHFAGMGNATAGDDTSARIIRLNGSGENTFNSCTFGIDTVLRTASNASIEFVTAKNNANNVFNGCIFTMAGDADAPRHLFIEDSGCNRFALFDNCKFFDNSDTTGISAQTDVIKGGVGTDQGGVAIFKDCIAVGTAGWSNEVTGVKILGSDNNATTLTNYCVGVNPTA